MKLKHILYILLILPFLVSCNQEDDIEEIFCSGNWYVVNYFNKVNWKKQKGTPQYTPTTAEGRKSLEIIQKFSINFAKEGTFKATIQNGSFEGRWEANSDDRTINLIIDGRPNMSSFHNREFVDYLSNFAIDYQGDRNVLMIGSKADRKFIQFTHGN